MDEIDNLKQRIKSIEANLSSLANNDAVIANLTTIPGIGLLTATALVAFVGHAHRFPSGRHFASFLGLTPREHSSGLSRHLGRQKTR